MRELGSKREAVWRERERRRAGRERERGTRRAVDEAEFPAAVRSQPLNFERFVKPIFKRRMRRKESLVSERGLLKVPAGGEKEFRDATSEFCDAFG